MIGIYFSGTGNTKFCIHNFLTSINKEYEMYSIEDTECIASISEHHDIVLAYPIYYSSIPKIMNDFIHQVSDGWKGKNVYIITTMALFSGDGAGLSARVLKKYGADIAGGLHVKMPDCIGDVRVLKKPLEQNKRITKEASQKIKMAAIQYIKGKPTRNGLSLASRISGLLVQRLYFYKKMQHYSNKLKIDAEACIGCGVCAAGCPMNNIEMENGKAVSKSLCTMCYRCISNCPKKAITLLGKHVIEQCKIERYL